MMRFIASMLTMLLPAAALAQTYPGQADYAGRALVTAFGAVCDGATDDTAALNAALSSGYQTVIIPNASCFSATGITVPPGIALEGAAWVGGSDPTLFTGGSRILCPVNIPNPCIEVGVNNGAFTTGSVSNLIIQGLGSAALMQGIGIRVDGLLNVSLNQIMVFNFFQGYYWKSYTVQGLGGKMWQAYSGRIKDAHLIVDSWPELQISQSRFGVNGGSDVGANTYVRFMSAAHDANPAGAANTFDCMNCQFNEGNGSIHVNHWLEFVNCGGTCFPVSGDAEIFRFTNNHVENVNYGIFTDSSWNILYGFKFTSSTLITFTDPFSQINAATTLLDFGITASRILSSGTNTLNLSTQSNGVKFVGSYFQGPVVVNGSGSGSRLIATGNTFINGLNVNGANWLSINLAGNEGGTNISQLSAVSSPTMQMDDLSRKIIAGDDSTLTITNTSAAANEKNWDLFSESGSISLRAVNDAYSSSTVPFSCTRVLSGSTGCRIQFPASSTGAVTQALTSSPCAAAASRWVPVTISGQSGTWFIPACQ